MIHSCVFLFCDSGSWVPCLSRTFKGIVHPKMLSYFTHPQVVPNLYECLCSAEHKRKIFWRKFVTRLFWGTSIVGKKIRWKSMMPQNCCFPHSSEYLSLCSAEQRHSYRFGTTWGWVNDDRIFIFGWTIPLNCLLFLKKKSFRSHYFFGFT